MWKFGLLLLMPFIMYSMFFCYFMFGDSIYSYYRNLSFIFLKLLSSFFRGTIDNVDTGDIAIRLNELEFSDGKNFEL
jgi:hypothetical protein